MAAGQLGAWSQELREVLGKHPWAQDLPTLCSLKAFAVPATCSIVAGLVLWWTIANLLSDKPIPYSVTRPEAPAEKKILEQPTIKTPGSSAIQCYAPATGQFLGLVNPSTPADIDRAISQASAAQKQWAQTTFRQRRAVLRTMLRHVLDHQEDICRVSSLDSGKTMLDAQLGEILVTAEKLQWTLTHGEAALRPSRRPTNLLMSYKRNEVRYEPLGVVAALVSWNYPFHNLMGPIISALFAGNAIIVKVSEQTCWSANYYADIARGALVAHGYDPILVQAVACWPDTAAHLTSHPGIGHLTFIGSRPVCHHVAASAAKTLTPLCAELGGKDPAIVLDSAASDLSRVTEILLRGSFQAAGQNCIGIERIIAGGAVYDRLVKALQPRVSSLRLGPEGDVGAMISDASFERLENLVADAVSKGARLLAGGKRVTDHPEHPGGFYFTPTLLVDVTPEMAVANEECFGPVMTLMRAPASPSPSNPQATADSILGLANSAPFGLGASVYGSESDPVLPLIVSGVRAGGVAVNDFAVYYAVQLPFGGVGGSGYGRFAGKEGLRGLCAEKSVCADRFVLPWWLGGAGIHTGIPPPAQYPVRSQMRGYRFASGVVEVGYGMSIWEKVKGVGRILANS